MAAGRSPQSDRMAGRIEERVLAHCGVLYVVLRHWTTSHHGGSWRRKRTTRGRGERGGGGGLGNGVRSQRTPFVLALALQCGAPYSFLSLRN